MPITEPEVINKVINEIFTNDIFADLIIKFIYFLFRILGAFLIFFFGKKILRQIFGFYRNTKYYNNLESSLKSFLNSIVNNGIIIMLIIFVLLILGVKQSSLITFIGTLGLGIGLALKDNLTNLAGGIIILTFETYKVGDEVEIDNNWGYVDKIDIFSTTIRNFDMDLIVIPNGKIISNQIINHSTTPIRRMKFEIGISYSNDIELARKNLEALLRSEEKILADPPVTSNVSSYGDSSINIVVKGWAKNEDYWTIYLDILNKLKSSLDKDNISIPFPQLDVHFVEKKF
ncbi:small conductance mechanosensitive channel [Cetobacterium ceti]|uniref:Small conductance mechanosensitive channel n=1 Tax=Cetobacterium ceti TaxID=180163 RepID=A0A1T4LF28_9FUSO|nr:mechanosensitive ion channel domain-containing protein [Cetobacterium ceti]SJZ53177.1 small conductance mechanosensitive channel [Cetobacterium ceti]